MAQAFRANRRNRAMDESLSSTFNVGSQPVQQKNNAIVVPAQNRKRYTLVTKEGPATEAGKYWYNDLKQCSCSNCVHIRTAIDMGYTC